MQVPNKDLDLGICKTLRTEPCLFLGPKTMYWVERAAANAVRQERQHVATRVYEEV